MHEPEIGSVFVATRGVSASGTGARLPRWRDANAEDERAERVRLRVTRGAVGEAPSARLDWVAVRDAVGVETAAIIEESARHAEEWARDAVRAHPIGITGECGGHGVRRPRDGIGGTALGP